MWLDYIFKIAPATGMEMDYFYIWKIISFFITKETIFSLCRGLEESVEGSRESREVSTVGWVLWMITKLSQASTSVFPAFSDKMESRYSTGTYTILRRQSWVHQYISNVSRPRKCRQQLNARPWVKGVCFYPKSLLLVVVLSDLRGVILQFLSILQHLTILTYGHHQLLICFPVTLCCYSLQTQPLYCIYSQGKCYH